MSVETLKLIQPLKVNGIERKELTYDIYALTVEDYANAENTKVKMLSEGSLGSGFVQTDFTLQICLGMQAIAKVNNDISIDDLKRISGYDVVSLGSIGQRFFMKPAESESNISEKQPEVTQESSTAPLKTVTTPL